MKKLLLCVVVALVFTTFSHAQDEQEKPYEMKTLFGNGNSNGFYGGLSAGYASIDDRNAVLIGARGAWILNHRLAIGIAGNGFITDFRFDPALNSDANFNGGYGGILLEPILFPESPVHITIPVLLGAGGVAYTKKITDRNYYENHHNFIVEEAEPFFFVKPGIELELNLIRFMRFSIGAYYMQTSNVSLDNASSGLLNGFSGMMTLKFGRF